MKKILLSLTVIGIIGAAAVGLTSAYFSDTETSANNNLTAGKLDLKIDNTSYYNHVLNNETSWLLDDIKDKLFFNFTDLKPSDIGEDTISIHVDNNNAWACMQLSLTKNADNTCTEPELIDDPNCTEPGEGQGELAQNLNFVFWKDDGDNVLESDETVFKEGSAQTLFDGSKWVLADSSSNLFEPTGPLLGSKTYYIGKAWCFGTLTQAPLPQDGVNNLVTPANTTGGVTCDGTALNNATQTDIVMGDISFSAYQARNNPTFLCNPTSPSPTPSPTPTPTEAPNPGERFVDAVTAILGTFGHCCDTNDLSSDPSVAAPAITGAPDSPPGSSFIQISQGSTVTAKFVDNKAFDGPGADIRVHVYDTLYPATATVEVATGPDCSTATWVPRGTISDTANADIDLSGSGLTDVQCIRLTDLGAPDTTYPTLGYDVDAIEALNSIAVP